MYTYKRPLTQSQRRCNAACMIETQLKLIQWFARWRQVFNIGATTHAHVSSALVLIAPRVVPRELNLNMYIVVITFRVVIDSRVPVNPLTWWCGELHSSNRMNRPLWFALEYWVPHNGRPSELWWTYRHSSNLNSTLCIQHQLDRAMRSTDPSIVPAAAALCCCGVTSRKFDVTMSMGRGSSPVLPDGTAPSCLGVACCKTCLSDSSASDEKRFAGSKLNYTCATPAVEIDRRVDGPWSARGPSTIRFPSIDSSMRGRPIYGVHLRCSVACCHIGQRSDAASHISRLVTCAEL